MARFRGDRTAFGHPGIEPRWTRGNKDGVGTPYSTTSRIWFTLWKGIVTEVYYPRVDRPQVRDLQFLLTDGQSFFHEEKRQLRSEIQCISRHVLGYRVINSDFEGRYALNKEVITDPHLSCVLQHVELTGDEEFLRRLKLYVLCAPHLEVGGWGNNAYVIDVAGRELLVAEKNGTWLALGATVPFTRLSCGYVGRSDGWSDLSSNMKMDWEFDRAVDGNVALTGELGLSGRREFTLGLALGDGLHHAVTTLFQALAVPYEEHRGRYIEQWNRPARKVAPLQKASGDHGALYHSSYSLLMAHEDKSYQGALIASLSIPWGEVRSDDDQGGYHLVWTRDMVNSASGLLAAGNRETAMRALLYLAASQQPDGGFPQNFWIDGRPYWTGVQLDEVAFPILLAWRLHCDKPIQDFDVYPMVKRAAAYLVRKGPATQQERWEEAAGYSPSTLAATIAALIGAALFARERGETAAAQFLETYADFLECHIEPWTVTTQGTLAPGISRHFIRIHPIDMNDPHADEDPDHGSLALANQPPGARWLYPAKDIVDAGFLELVRYGIRKAGDPLIEDSLRVVDALLKVQTPYGPVWRRYNHDGYGQRDDGGGYQGWGKGRAWPLLTGERGHYELAAGRDVRPYLHAMERFASSAGLLPEQVWDEPDRTEIYMSLGRPTGSAMPLMWAHAEYIRLLHSAYHGHVFDRIPAIAQRYLGSRQACQPLEVWKPNRQPRTVRRGWTLRVQAPAAFILRWTQDDWQTVQDSPSEPTGLGIELFDIKVPAGQQAPVRFTFYWKAAQRWEGQDYEVAITE